jgi:hypothetical protein
MMTECSVDDEHDWDNRFDSSEACEASAQQQRITKDGDRTYSCTRSNGSKEPKCVLGGSTRQHQVDSLGTLLFGAALLIFALVAARYFRQQQKNANPPLTPPVVAAAVQQPVPYGQQVQYLQPVVMVPVPAPPQQVPVVASSLPVVQADAFVPRAPTAQAYAPPPAGGAY